MKSLVVSFLLFTFCLFPAFALELPVALVDEDLNWQTYETTHFRAHFPPELKEWAMLTIAEMEAFQKEVAKQGFTLDEKVEAVVIDPMNLSNGFALPLSYEPTMALFATPPQSDRLGGHAGWQQFLSVHEYIHLVHLAQKSRSERRNQIGRWFDLYDLKNPKSPRWVSEGFATLMESILTGKGRLYDHYYEANLKALAAQGRFPTYAELNKGNTPYIVGARFLHWLQTQYGEEKLQQVWTRWNAKKARTFEQAFKGVYLRSSKSLYQEFALIYVNQVYQELQELAESEAKLWFEFKGSATAPVVSADGKRLALLARIKNKPNLVVYQTQENLKAKEKFEKAQKKLLENDPVDVPDAQPKTFVKKQLAKLELAHYPFIQSPRWQDDQNLLFSASIKEKKAQARFDLHSWNIKSGKVTRLTFGQGIRRFDVRDNLVIAERSRAGYSQLVKLDLTSGQLTELTPPSLKTVYDFPRIAPQTQQLAYLRQNMGENWQLLLRDLDTGEEQLVALPNDYNFLSFPEWSRNGQALSFIASQQGRLLWYHYLPEKSELQQLSSGKQLMLWPTPLDGANWLHLSPSEQGLDLFVQQPRVLSMVNKLARTSEQSAPTGPLAKAGTSPLPKGKLSPYGLGKQKGSFILGASFNSASSDLLELGYHSSDLLRRLSWQVNASHDVTNGELAGTSFWVNYKPWAVDLRLQGYALDESPMAEKSGLLLEASAPVYEASYHKLLLAARYGLTHSNAGNTQWVQSLLQHQGSWLLNGFKLSQQAEISWLQGYSDQNDWQGHDLNWQLAMERKGWRLGGELAWLKRSDHETLHLGGFQSALIAKEALPNHIFAPELTFIARTGDEYLKTGLFAGRYGGQLFYQEHRMQGTPHLSSFGIRGKKKLELGLTRFDGLTLDAGIARVRGGQFDSDTEYWLSVFYQY